MTDPTSTGLTKPDAPRQQAISETQPLSFPRALALFTCLSRSGYDTDDIYLSFAHHPEDHVLRITVTVLPPEARPAPTVWAGKRATFFCEVVDPELSSNDEAVMLWLQRDGEKWNTLSQADREAHMHRYMKFSEQTALVILLMLRGMPAPESRLAKELAKDAAKQPAGH